MITDTINDSLQQLDQLKQSTDSSLINSINSLVSELNNLQIILSSTNLNISNNGTTLLPATTAQVKCSFSLAPGAYLSTRAQTLISNLPGSNITDSKLGVNILPFTGCTNPANPTMNPFVFPWTCVPNLTPFTPTNPTMLLQNIPVTTINSKAICTFAAGGVVSFLNGGQINAKTS